MIALSILFLVLQLHTVYTANKAKEQEISVDKSIHYKFIVVIKVGADEFRARNILRESGSWLTHDWNLPDSTKWKYFFLVGRSMNKTVNSQVCGWTFFGFCV